jgi:S-DNA-T family DNA segregation ATPase FtsK/SpoIIIE
MWILYAFYKNEKIEVFERIFAVFIFFVSFAILQSLVLSKGAFGNIFVDAMKPFIGNVGIILIIIFLCVISFMILKLDMPKIKLSKKIELLDKFKNVKKEYKKEEFIENKNIEELEIEKPSVKEIQREEKKDQFVEDYIKHSLENIHNIEPSNELEEEVVIKDNNKNDTKIVSEENKKEEIYDEVKAEEKIDEIPKKEVIKEETEIENNIENEVHKEIEIKEEIKEIEIPKVEEEPEEIEPEKEENNEVKEAKKIEPEQREYKEIEPKKIEIPKQTVENVEDKKVRIVSELDENNELLKDIEKGNIVKPKDFQLPNLEFLKASPKRETHLNEEEIDKKVNLLLNKLRNFKIEGDVVRTYTGPVVTTFEFKPLAHIKVSKILNLQDDLAMALKASTIRIQAPIPGKDVVGIEIPNDEIETIYLREILETDLFKNSKAPLLIALGKDIVGKPFVTDLAKLPHLLIAGTTGSGKSVGINAMILSLLYRNSPDDLKLMMIDPKMLEFSIYNDIPHLLTPVITEAKKALTGLSNMVKEMERRYKLMSDAKVKNIENYNAKFSENKMPYIVVVIDELADLMMTGGKDVEYSIARLAQMARASGIHLIVATQRPSVDVVTGLIKANLPSRISYKVGQKIDSKVILDTFGAESLLGRGDMLFTPPGSSTLVRLHAPFTTEEEIEEIVEFLKAQRSVNYDEHFLAESVDSDISEDIENKDELYEEAKQIIINENKTSISYLQRRLQIGYNRAANIIEQLERSGFLSAPNSKGQREIIQN